MPYTACDTRISTAKLPGPLLATVERWKEFVVLLSVCSLLGQTSKMLLIIATCTVVCKWYVLPVQNFFFNSAFENGTFLVCFLYHSCCRNNIILLPTFRPSVQFRWSVLLSNIHVQQKKIFLTDVVVTQAYSGTGVLENFSPFPPVGGPGHCLIASVAQWLGRWIRDRNVHGSLPSWCATK